MTTAAVIVTTALVTIVATLATLIAIARIAQRRGWLTGVSHRHALRRINRERDPRRGGERLATPMDD